MKAEIITNILNRMTSILDSNQIAELKSTLYICLQGCEITKPETEIIPYDDSNQKYLDLFLMAKGATGLSQRTLNNYRLTITMFFDSINKPIDKYTDDDFLCYLENYRRSRNVSFVRIKNMQSALSSFWSWLYRKKYVPCNPVANLDSIKLPKKVKHPLSDEERELLKINCEQLRDLAIMEFLYSTGVRVSELVALNIADVSFTRRDCTICGKGSKEREVYINAPAGLYLQRYLASRTDSNPALFVGLSKPHNRLTKNAVESILRKLGQKCGIPNVHPHRFRRTMATNALNRGMPIEQVSRLLGHTKLDTTQIYCTVSQEQVRMSHKKYLSA